MFYNRFITNKNTWLTGSFIYLLMILIAFLGYVLPWGQIRYWGATVISSLITTIPTIGKWLLVIIWGDYSVSNRTLNRFYTLHFILPFVVLTIITIHLIALHLKGRTTILGRNKIIVPFRSYYLLKDLIGFVLLIVILLINVIFFSRIFLDRENSVQARPLVTPIHIVPEWYFLYAYCILKSFDSKVIGVIILIFRVIFFIILGLKKIRSQGLIHKIVIIIWIVNFIRLTKIGGLDISHPYSYIRKICTALHFTPLRLGLQVDIEVINRIIAVNWRVIYWLYYVFVSPIIILYRIIYLLFILTLHYTNKVFNKKYIYAGFILIGGIIARSARYDGILWWCKHYKICWDVAQLLHWYKSVPGIY